MAKRNLMNGAAVPMEPGERDRAVTIQQLEETIAPGRLPKETWILLATPVWFRKLDAKSSEKVKSDQVAANFDTQWEMGYRGDMDPDLIDVPKKRRLLYQGRIYPIVGASQIGRREGIEVLTLSSTKVGAP
jgi:hypothetical protein